MKPFRMARWSAVMGVLAALFLAPAGSAMASVTIPDAPPPENGTFVPVCANGGAGLCLQDNLLSGSLIANENMISSGASNSDTQAWSFEEIGQVSHGRGAGPFSNSALDDKVTSGRVYGQWEAFFTFGQDPKCLAYENGEIILTKNCGPANDPGTGTLWVLSGSGRLINVLHSDEEGDLQFLNSSGVNSGNPSLHTGNACPAACWGPDAG